MENFETAIAELNKEQHIPQSIVFTVQEDFISNLPQIVSNLEQVEEWAIAQTEEDRTAVLETDVVSENQPCQDDRREMVSSDREACGGSGRECGYNQKGIARNKD